jgi:predicted N-acetyltransferase YhbS
MECIIRSEIETDSKQIHELVKSAFFKKDKIIHFNAWQLVDNIRNSSYFNRELSLVAVYRGGIVGHILLTPLKIENGQKEYDSITMSPLSVMPQFQNKGIGRQLISEGFRRAKALGYRSIIVLGHASFLTKFGFELASKWHICIEDHFTNKSLFALELVKNELSEVTGTVKYCEPFYNRKGELR